MKHISQPHPILDGVEKVSGRLDYLDDMQIGGMLHTKLVFSTVPHGRILHLETEAARQVAGVAYIFHHGNTPANTYNSTVWYEDQDEPEDERMFPMTVRHVGDRVAAVVAETPEAARKAAALIKVTYEELPAFLTCHSALDHDDRPRQEGGMHLAEELRFDYGRTDADFAQAELVVTSTITTPRTHHCALENHACVAMPESDGRILILSPCQSIFSVQMVTARALGVPAAQIRVIKTAIGGSFGGKAEPVLDPLCAHFAHVLQRPVGITLDRTETFTATRTRSGATGRIRTAVSRDGRILARDTDVRIDIGAYQTGGGFLPGAMSQRLCRLYDVPSQRYRGRAVLTNTVPSGAYRGYGSPQIHAISEINIDHTARALGMDPVAFRLKNLIEPGACDPLTGIHVGNARIRNCVEQGAECFDWQARRVPSDPSARFRRGVGMACATHINGCYPDFHEATTARLSLRPDGRLDLTCALHDLGCGSNTVLAQIIAEVLDVVPTDIVFSEVDSDICSYDLGTRASRMTYIVGEAVRRTTEKLKSRLLEIASLALNHAAVDVILEGGMFRTSGDSTQAISLAELFRWADSHGTALEAIESYRATANPGSYAAHFAEVEVDVLTGSVKVLDYLAVHDLGRALNRRLVEGQIQGGVQMGIGYALLEDISIDPATGAMKGDRFSSYHLVNAPQMPAVRTLLVERGEPTGPYGAKAVGEIATIPPAPAIVNAVSHALKRELTKLPITQDRIVASMR
ncbi:MAG: molybdopterin-dependent oxidoreductase [Hyphomicrobiales bacterium]|nr:molybdopterin-dependent oxidoreductase [Hyphomicrobiales bacterium]